MSELDTLSPRERNVFDLVIQGMTNKQIARELGIEECTTKVHVRKLFLKLRVERRINLIAKYANKL